MFITPQAAASSLSQYYSFKSQLPMRNSLGRGRAGAVQSYSAQANFAKRYKQRSQTLSQVTLVSQRSSKARSNSRKKRNPSQQDINMVASCQSSANQSLANIGSNSHLRILDQNINAQSTKQLSKQKENHPPKGVLPSEAYQGLALNGQHELAQTINQASISQVQTLHNPRPMAHTFSQDWSNSNPYGNSLPSLQTAKLLLDTNQELGMLSLCDQSEGNKSHNTAELHLREENMILRMEVLKLKKQLFMKAQLEQGTQQLGSNIPASENSIEIIRRFGIEKDAKTSQNNSQSNQQQKQAPEQEPRILKCNSSNSFLAKPVHQLRQMSTVEELREDNETRDLDDLERFLKDQGIHIREELLNECEDKRGMSSIFEQKRHYEQEIEVLKSDLQLIEAEEQKIKSRLFDKTTLFNNASIRSNAAVFNERNVESETNISHERVEEKNHPLTQAFDKFLERKAECNSYTQQSMINDKQQRQQQQESQSLNCKKVFAQWQPPSFANSQIQSYLISPCNIPTVQPLCQQPTQNIVPTEATFCQKSRRRMRRSRGILKHPQTALGTTASDVSHQDKTVANNATNNEGTVAGSSCRLNTEIIDQMFEDPKIQSQFQCLDNEAAFANFLEREAATHRSLCKPIEEESMSLHDFEVQPYDVPKFQSTYHQYGIESLQRVKNNMKGVLQSYEQSFKNQSDDAKFYISDGLRASKQSTLASKNDSAIARLSTIKEDSPEFAGYVVESIDPHQRMPNTKQTYSHEWEKPNESMPTQYQKIADVSEIRDIQLRNQPKFQHQHKPSYQIFQHYNAPVSNIVNKAYQEALKRKQRESIDLSYKYSSTTTRKPNIMQVKPRPAIQTSSKPVGSNYSQEQCIFNGHQNKLLAFNNNSKQKQNLKKKVTQLKSKSPVSRNQSKGSQRPHSIDEPQYDLLWSKQVVTKRNTLMKRKEELNRERYNLKLARIEEIQRKKLQDMAERKVKSKSPSHQLTTLSENECTPNHHNRYMNGFTSVRAPHTPILKSKAACLMIRPTQAFQFPQSSKLSINPSGINSTVNMSLEHPASDNVRTPELSNGNTPLGSNGRRLQDCDVVIPCASYIASTKNIRASGSSSHGRNALQSRASTFVLNSNTGCGSSYYSNQGTSLQASLQFSGNHSRSSSISKLNLDKRVRKHVAQRALLREPCVIEGKLPLSRAVPSSQVEENVQYEGGHMAPAIRPWSANRCGNTQNRASHSRDDERYDKINYYN